MTREQQYQRVMDREVPVHWDGLSAKQFVRISRILAHGAHLPNVQVQIAWTVLGLSWRTPRLVAAVFVGLNAEQRHRLAVSLSAPFLKDHVMTATLVPTLRAGATMLHVCNDDLLNEVDAYTWGLADAWFMRYAKSKWLEHLRAMASVLYAPKGMPRAQRLKGGSQKLVERVTESDLQALYLNWGGLRRTLEVECPWVFRSANQKTAQRRQRGWMDVLRSMAGARFGPFDSTCTTPIRILLKQMNDDIQAAKRAEEERERRERKLIRY